MAETTATTEPPTEDVVSKYKRLLTLARTSLEANQATLAARDKYITQLQKALEEEKVAKNNRRASGRDDEALIPRNLVRRMDVDELIWLLVEYEGADDSWLCFGSEQELLDFVQRIPGAPLSIPQRSFSPAESQRIESESRKRVERVVEEFRRYKVRTEIARKNKDAETKLATAQRTQQAVITSSGTGNTLPSLMEKSLTDGTMGDGTNTDELHRLKAQLTEQESKWRQAYEKVVKENELLRTRGGEAMLATQWRERYEACQREKDDLVEKLKLHMKPPNMRGDGYVGGNNDQKTIEQAYNELRHEYKEFRRRVSLSDYQQRLMNDSTDGNQSPGPLNNPLNDMLYLQSPMPNSHNGNDPSYGMTSTGRNMGLGESKIQYVRHMVFQYLSCKDASVKPHMESALIALFRYNETERAAIEEIRKANDVDTIASITNFLGSFT